MTTLIFYFQILTVFSYNKSKLRTVESRSADIPSMIKLWMNQDGRQQFQDVVRRRREVIEIIENRPQTIHNVSNLQRTPCNCKCHI